MNRIIYVDGAIADQLGHMGLRALGQQIANDTRQPVDVLTHGASKYHAEKRITCEPLEG